jgi:hypothetical protein
MSEVGRYVITILFVASFLSAKCEMKSFRSPVNYKIVYIDPYGSGVAAG